MPVTVKLEEVPTFVRQGTVTKYADIFNHLTGWLKEQAAIKDEKKQSAVAYTGLLPEEAALPEDEQPENDGVTVDSWGAIASGVRRVAKDMGHKVTLVFREDEMRLYVKFGGPFVALTREQINQRAAKRRTNRIAKLAEKYVSEGMTEANAKKRAEEEVGKLKVV
jgi:hypothetical protein